MKKIILIPLFLILFSITVKSQDYNTGIGLRGGPFFNGVSAKHFVTSNVALEGILTTRWSGFNITGLYEIHDQAFNTDRLNWYYGLGAHIGFWEGADFKWADDIYAFYTVIGVDGIIGLEYNFYEIPINISIDWKPIINLIGHSSFWGDDGAISIRYIF